MLLEQFYLGCLAHASYLIADESTGRAAVVDPQRDVDCYLEFAERHGLTVAHVVLTHLHADFIAGHLELRDRVGATIYLGARATAEYAFVPLRGGDRIDLGRVCLQALETPGHTPESISIQVFDLDRAADEPYAVLTGDTLFVGDVGRPDLRASLGWSARDLGALLYESLRTKLLPLPDATRVYPAHGAGSLCGKALGHETWSTIGEQRRSNYALQPMGQETFIEMVTTDQPEAPPYFTYDAVLNARERPTLEQTLERQLHPVTLDHLLAVAGVGGQVLDVRDPEEFAAAHLAGSINIGLNGQYATWAGTVLSRDRPIVIVANPGREAEAAIRLGRIGFDHVLGYLQNGLLSLDSRPDLTATTERISAQLAAERIASPEPPLIVDVRAPSERQEKAIPGSAGVPLNHLLGRLDEIGMGRPLLVHCAGGYRSSIAASLLQARGHAVSELAGGIAAWESAGLPLEGSSVPRANGAPPPP